MPLLTSRTSAAASAMGFGLAPNYPPPNSLVAAVGGGTLVIYRRSDWGVVPNPATLPGGVLKSVTFSPDRRMMAVTGTGAPGIVVYDTATWKILFSSNTGPGPNYQATFSADSRKLVTDYPAILDIATWTWTFPSGGVPSGIRDTILSPDNSKVVSTDGDILYVWNAADMSAAGSHTLPANIHSSLNMAWSPDGTKVAVNGINTSTSLTTIVVYNTSDWSVAANFPMDNTDAPNDSFPGICVFSPDGTYLYAGGEVHVVKFAVADWSKVAAANLLGAFSGVTRYAGITPDGSLLLIGPPSGNKIVYTATSLADTLHAPATQPSGILTGNPTTL